VLHPPQYPISCVFTPSLPLQGSRDSSALFLCLLEGQAPRFGGFSEALSRKLGASFESYSPLQQPAPAGASPVQCPVHCAGILFIRLVCEDSCLEQIENSRFLPLPRAEPETALFCTKQAQVPAPVPSLRLFAPLP